MVNFFNRSSELTPVHGGDVIRASEAYGIAVSDWLDLSTGLNPNSYPVVDIAEYYYRKLPPSTNASLINAAKDYYGCGYLLAAPGSQRLIQLLPQLRSPSRVAIPNVGYQEHHYHWQRNGHTIVFYNAWQPQLLSEKIDNDEVDCVVLINPCNPTAVCVDPLLLLQWQKKLAQKGGWLIIDEAFADTRPEISLARYSCLPGVIVLRSLGKFFGLAGIRVGFVLCEPALGECISVELGPWSVAGPSQLVATDALQNRQWQIETRKTLRTDSQWMLNTLQNTLDTSIKTIAGTELFLSVTLDAQRADAICNAMAERGILIRYWAIPASDCALLRFGLISENASDSRRRFQSVLSEVLASCQMFSIT